MKKFTKTPTHIAIHHSATSRDYTKFETLRKNHKAKGLHDIAYHFGITGDSKRHIGRSLRYQGVHAGNYNSKAIGIVVMGHFDNQILLDGQKNELEILLDELRAKYSMPRKNIKGHGEVMNTKCPGKNLMHWIREYRKVDTTPPIVNSELNLCKAELNIYKKTIKEIYQIINKLKI